MRKSIAILLLLGYILVSSGVGIRAFYSGDKLTSVHLILDRSAEKAHAKAQQPGKDSQTGICSLSGKTSPLKKLLQCATIVSNGFFEAYDDTVTTPACNTCAAASSTQVYPSHMVSID